jgi:ADP-heptose:LPS heptosyltransferase
MMKILVIRNHRLGDILQLTPMLAGLKRKHPESKITFVTGTDFQDLLVQNKNVDRVISFSEVEFRSWMKHNPERYPFMFNRVYDFCHQLKAEHMDLTINRQYEEGGILAGLVGGKRVLGGRYVAGEGLVFDDTPSRELHKIIRSDRSANKRNLVDWSCLIAGVSPGNESMVMNISELDLWRAEKLLSQGGGQNGQPLIAIQLGAAKPFRQWGSDNYVELIEYLLTSGKRVVLLGTESEKDLSEVVAGHIGRRNGQIVDLLGKTSIRDLGAVLQRCDILITGDTGTMHVATAVGTPVLSIFFGTAYPWETGPYGTGHFVLYADEPCAPCLKPELCEVGHKCKKTITPEKVETAFKIADAVRRGKPVNQFLENGSVKLFVTRVEPDIGQSLVPIQDWVKKGMVLKKRINHQNVKPDSVEGLREFFSDQAILKPYYTGNRVDFLANFSSYLDWLSWLIDRRQELKICQSTPQEELLAVLQAAFSDGASALQAEDVARLADLVRYGLGDVARLLLDETE